MTDPREPGRVPDGWQNCSPEQMEVMLLGTYHMDDPGLDGVNVDADDVLADHRQAELRDPVDSLADWNPDRRRAAPSTSPGSTGRANSAPTTT